MYRASFALPPPTPNLPVVLLHKVFDDAHPQAGALDRCRRSIRPPELFKDVRQLFAAHPHAFVRNSHFHVTAYGDDADDDRARARGVFGGVREQIAHHLADTLLVGTDLRPIVLGAQLIGVVWMSFLPRVYL